MSKDHRKYSDFWRLTAKVNDFKLLCNGPCAIWKPAVLPEWPKLAELISQRREDRPSLLENAWDVWWIFAGKPVVSRLKFGYFWLNFSRERSRSIPTSRANIRTMGWLIWGFDSESFSPRFLRTETKGNDFLWSCHRKKCPIDETPVQVVSNIAIRKFTARKI